MTSTREPDNGSPPLVGSASNGAAVPSDGSGGQPLSDPLAGGHVAALATAVQALVGQEPWRLSDDDLARLLQRVEVERRRLLMVQVAVAAEARTRGLPRQAGFGPGGGVKDGETAALANWVRSLVNMAHVDARQIAEVGAVLLTDPVAADLAETKAAALSGQITSRHVAAIAKGVTELSPPHGPVDPVTGGPAVDEETRRDAQRVLVEHALVLDPTQTAVVAKRAVAVLDPAAGERLAQDEEARADLRGLSFTPDGTGLVHLRGVLTPTCAGLLATAIDAASAPRSAADGTRDSRTAAMRRHDGLQHVLGKVVAADGLLPSTHGTPYRLVVTVPHATLASALGAAVSSGVRPATRSAPARPAQTSVARPPGPGTDRQPGAAETSGMKAAPVLPGLLPDGFPLSPLSVQTMACSAELVPVLVDDDHQPLDVGDTQYAFPPKVRTAIIARDKGCTYPGCGAPAPWCDCHHLVPFSRGGATSVDNGVLLCGRHHRYVHALSLTGRVVCGGGASHVEWDHRPTSWTATSASTSTSTAARHQAASRDPAGRDPAGRDPGGRDPGDTGQARPAPALTDCCLDQLIQRWQRRRHQAQARAA